MKKEAEKPMDQNSEEQGWLEEMDVVKRGSASAGVSSKAKMRRK